MRKSRNNPYLDELYEYQSGKGKAKTLANLQPGPRQEVETFFINQPTDPFWKQHTPEQVFQRAIETDPTPKKYYTKFLLASLGSALQSNTAFDWWNETGARSIMNEYLRIWSEGQKGMTGINPFPFNISVYQASMTIPGDQPAPSSPTLQGLVDYMLNNNLITRDLGGAKEKLQTLTLLQNDGAAFWLNKDKITRKDSDLKDTKGRRWIVVDLITDEGAKILTKGSGWCTQAGSFYNYLPKTGLIYCYCIDWIQDYLEQGITDKDQLVKISEKDPFEFQLTSATHQDEQVGYGSEDGFFQEQKLPNNVVFNFGSAQQVNRNGKDCDWLGPLLKPLKEYAQIVQMRAEASGGNPIVDPLNVYLSNGNSFAGTKYAKIDQLYGGQLNVPPLLAIDKYTEAFKFLFKNSASQVRTINKNGSTNVSRNDAQMAIEAYNLLRKGKVPANLLQCALAMVRSYPIYISVNNRFFNGYEDKDAAKYLKNPKNLKVKSGSGSSKTYTSWAHIPKGEYQVTGDGDIAHMRAFAMCKYEVTVEFWLFVMQKTPADKDFLSQSEPNVPVVYVNWYDCLRFCNKLSELLGLEPVYKIGSGETPEVDWIWSANGFRLPSECEWETAAREPPQRFKKYQMQLRGQTVDAFPTAGMSFTYAGSDVIKDVAWYSGNSQDRAHPVGELQSNGWGIYDMSGNVFEWCYDTYGSYADKKSYPDDC